MRALAKLNGGPVLPLPDLQTLAVASGIPALEDVSTWIGLVAPAGTPRPIINKIQKAVAKMYADPAFIAHLREAGINPVGSTPEEMDGFERSELTRWSKVVEGSGIQPN